MSEGSEPHDEIVDPETTCKETNPSDPIANDGQKAPRFIPKVLTEEELKKHRFFEKSSFELRKILQRLKEAESKRKRLKKKPNPVDLANLQALRAILKLRWEQKMSAEVKKHLRQLQQRLTLNIKKRIQKLQKEKDSQKGTEIGNGKGQTLDHKLEEANKEVSALKETSLDSLYEEYLVAKKFHIHINTPKENRQSGERVPKYGPVSLKSESHKRVITWIINHKQIRSFFDDKAKEGKEEKGAKNKPAQSVAPENDEFNSADEHLDDEDDEDDEDDGKKSKKKPDPAIQQKLIDKILRAKAMRSTESDDEDEEEDSDEEGDNDNDDDEEDEDDDEDEDEEDSDDYFVIDENLGDDDNDEENDDEDDDHDKTPKQRKNAPYQPNTKGNARGKSNDIFISSLSGSSRGRPAPDNHQEPKKRNRMGQRQRRLLAEQQYGTTAKHLEQERRQQSKGGFASAKPYGNRPSGRDNGGQDRKRKQQEETEQLHPSWQAKRMQNQKISLNFKAQRVTFDE